MSKQYIFTERFENFAIFSAILVRGIKYLGLFGATNGIGGSEYSSRPGMAEKLDFTAARMDEKPASQVFAKSLGHGFDHQAYRGHKVHGQGRVRTEAAIGGGRKAGVYAALGMCHTIVHEPDGACPSIRHPRKSSTGVLANSTSNVEEPYSVAT